MLFFYVDHMRKSDGMNKATTYLLKTKKESIIIIIIIIIWFGDTVTVSHSTKCDTNSKVRALS